MKKLNCPYCRQAKTGDISEFCGCRFCGFKSAVINNEDKKLLIIDREMPYLRRHHEELREKYPDVEVIVDRRIAQDPFHPPDKRNKKTSKNYDGEELEFRYQAVK